MTLAITGHTAPPHLTATAGTVVAAVILILALALIAIAKDGAEEADIHMGEAATEADPTVS